MRSDCSFVDIGGIVDHHCLNSLFVMAYYSVELFLFLLITTDYSAEAISRKNNTVK